MSFFRPSVSAFQAGPRVGLLPTPGGRPTTYQFFTNPTTPITRPTITIVRPATVLAASPNSPGLNGAAPLTTVFIGNISDKVDNEVVKLILNQCGNVANWKRIQGTDGKFQAFGFCEYEHPEGTTRALRVLADYPLGDKKLVVKVEEKTRKMIRDFMEVKRAESGLPPEILSGDQLPVDETSLKEDTLANDRILQIIKEKQPDLLRYEIEVSEEKKEKESSSSSSESEDDSKRRRSRSSSRKRSRRRSASSDRGSKRRRRYKRSRSSSHSSSSSGSSAATSAGEKRRRYSRSGSDTEDSEAAKEKSRLRRAAKKKQAEYEIRVKRWEEREKRMAKNYLTDDEKEVQKKRSIMKEAKKLKAFLEDYDDERDDLKYYKSSALFQRRRDYDYERETSRGLTIFSKFKFKPTIKLRSSALFQRRRDYERERELDAKDRQEEHREIEELKRQILETGEKIEDADAEARKRHEAHEKEMLQKHRESGSPNPHIPLGQKRSGKSEAETSDEDKKDDESTSSDAESSKGKEKSAGTWVETSAGPESQASTPPIKAPAIQLTQTSVKANLNAVFGEEEEEIDKSSSLYVIKAKLKPFEITGEERAQVITPEERKKMIKDLIDRIPTGKEELFNYTVQWEFVDSKLVENRIQPWVNKKIRDYLGEDEPALANFIGEKITAHVEPEKLLADLSLVLDDEAEVFIVKMWRLIIYESEAKKLGISAASAQPSNHHHQTSSSSSRSREKSHRKDRERRH